jgi:hypothetical protein
MKGVSMILIWIFAIAILFLFAFDQLAERMYRYEKKSALVTPKKYDIPFRP